MSIVNIIKEPEYYYPAGMAEQDGLMTYQEFQKLDSIPTPSNIVTKSSTAGLLKNDGTVDSNSYVKKSDLEGIKTATGNPITLTDAIAGNAIEVSAEIVAEQDLHGYDYPWVGGAGKNKIPFTIAGIKAANGGAETWTDNKKTISNAEVELLSDDAGNCIGIKINGTTNGNIILALSSLQDLRGDYILSGCPSGGGATAYEVCLIDSTLSQFVARDFGSGASVTITEDYVPRVVVRMNVTCNNLLFKPMLRLSTVSDSTFEPYTNICPITGFSSVTITDVDVESHTATVTVSLGQTVYGGNLNLTTGVLTVTHGYIASYNGETIGEPWISSLDEYSQGGTPTAGAQVVYPLATPTTTTLTASQLALVKGYNQLSCNSGDMEITYKASGLDALNELLDNLQDRLGDVEDDIDNLAISELTDVAISSPTNGQVMTFDSVTGKWGNQNPSGGSTISKKRYTITASSWSNSIDANGYYTYTITLSNPTLSTSYPPNVYLTGANDNTFYTDTEAEQYSYVAQCNLTTSTSLVLYAKTKPESDFYIFVEGLPVV